MKSLLIRLSFVPFALAILWGGKMMFQKLVAAPDTSQVNIVLSEASLENSPTSTMKITRPDTKVQLALLLDVSGSMSGLIRQAQARLWQVVNELSRAEVDGYAPSLEISLYIYGGDHLSPEKGYVRQLTPFTTDLDLISERLFALTTNGGEEYCAEVIQAAMTELSWSRNPSDLKLIFIAGNEGFNQGPRLYTQVCPNAREKGIIVNTIYCGAHEEGKALQWEAGAALARGQYLSINHNQSVADIATPYDARFAQLNSELNQTFVYYGTEGRKRAQNLYLQDSNAAELSTGAACDRAQTKTSKNYFQAAQNWDLVEANNAGQLDFSKLDKSTLPEEYRSYSKQQLIELANQKQQERERIQSEINKLNQARQTYLMENQKEADNALGTALVQCLQKQATDKGYSFPE
jgi:hypothetical protein